MRMGDFRYVPIIAVPFFLILVVIFGIIIFVWLKGNSAIVKKLPIILAVLHFVLAIVLSIIILVLLKHDGEAGMLWYIFHYLDWPVSVLIKSEKIWRIWVTIFKLPIIRIIPDAIVGNVVFPFVNFGILGTLQYFVVGYSLGKIIELFRK